jgi:hypothetical protein
MKIYEILNEVRVQSSWISDLTYNRPHKVLTLQLSNGRQFSIPNISRRLFDMWKSAPSKGAFYHQQIKGNYKVIRIK